MNQNWSKWIFASLAKHFEDAKGDIAHYFVQGVTRVESEDIERLEFRWTGLNYDEQTEKSYHLEFTVGLLLTAPFSGKNNYRMQELTGRMSNAFRSTITIKKYGNAVGDDASVIGCLQLKGKVRVHDWGQINSEIKVTQSSVESDLTIDLQE